MKRLVRKEKDIENEILTYLNFKIGAFAFKINTGGFFDTKRKVFRKNTSRFLLPGTPDIICMYNYEELPILILFEVKSETGRQSADQKSFEQTINDFGGFYFLVRSVTSVEVALTQVRVRLMTFLAEKGIEVDKSNADKH